MSPDPRLKRLLEVMRDQHGCHTVILYGSRTRGDANADSDYDVLGVRDAGPALRDARPWEGSFLDAFIYPASDLLELEPGMDRLAIGEVLLERDGCGQELLARARELASRPVVPLAPDDRQLRRAWLLKMLGRVSGRDARDVEAHYRRAWLLYQLLEDFFALRALPYRGPKESLAWLVLHDPASDAAFRTGLAPGASDEDLAALVAHVLATTAA